MDEKYKKLVASLMRLTDQKRCALWFSGGKDSLLLLEVLRRFNLAFAVLCFDTAFSKQQKENVQKIVRQYNLLVYSYPPKAMTLIGDGANIALAQMFAVDRHGAVASVIADLTGGTRCAFDVNLKLSEKPHPPIRFDTHILGSKKNDTHWAGSPAVSELRRIGECAFAAPLFDWTDAQVIELLVKLGVDYTPPDETIDTGNIPACHNCLLTTESGQVFCPKENKEIPVHDWNPVKNLENWKRC